MELPQRRTATTDTFELENGERETRVYESPVNFEDAEGEWKPINEELEVAPGGAITNGANSFDLHLPEQLGTGAVRVSSEGQWVSYRYLGPATGAAELEGSVATYEGKGDQPTFELKSLANGLKESILIGAASGPSDYAFELEAAPGVTPTLEEGAIVFRSSDEEVVATMPSPTIADASEGEPTGAPVSYSLAHDGEGRWKLAVEVDREWMQAPDRVWPSVIDPTVTVPSPEADCMISSASEANMCGSYGWTYLQAKTSHLDNGETQPARSLLRFNLSSIPTTASVTSATVGLTAPAAAQNVSKVDLWALNRSWTRDGVSWRYWGTHNSSSEWTTKGGDYSIDASNPTSITTAQRGSQAGLWAFSSLSLNFLVQRWLDGTVPNNGVLVKLSEETYSSCTPSCAERRVQWESSADTNKPYLSVTYISPAPADSKVTSPTDGTRTPKRFLLTAAWEHTGVEGVTFQYKGEKGWTNIPESQVTNESGAAVKWPISVELKARQSKPVYWDASAQTGTANTGKVEMRAVLSGQVGAGGYTKPVSGEVNKETGGPKDATAQVGPGSLDLMTGNFTLTRNDAAIPGFAGTLEFSRSISSREPGVESEGVLGPGWKPGSPVEEAGGSNWRAIKLESFTEEWEEENEEEGIETHSFTYRWAALSDLEGGQLSFEETSPGNFLTPPEVSGYQMTQVSGSEGHEIALTDPAGNRTVFSNAQTANNEYIPVSVGMTGGNKTRYLYEFPGAGRKRLHEVIAPAAAGIECPDATATTTVGCHVLSFNYGLASGFTRLLSITYYAAGNAGGPWTVAQYGYNPEGRLTEEWDPRISPPLKETYAYDSSGHVKTLTPAGQEPWTLTYATSKANLGRLENVKRASLVKETPTAQTTISYGVSLSGGSGRESMTAAAVGAWGQKDAPTDATAIFPPGEIPSGAYTRANIYYLDAEGQTVNVSTPAGAGTTAPSITTTETDRFGNVVRELSAQNRLRSLAAGEGSAAKSRELDTEFFYSADGARLEEEVGPQHLVKITDTGETRQARAYRSLLYSGDPTPPAGEPAYNLPTTETTGAMVSSSSVLDQRTTTYEYNWTLRKPEATTVDPEELKIKSKTIYNSKGQVTEARQPSNPNGGGAGTTKTVYYTAGSGGNCESYAYAGLACKSEPAAQAGTEPPLLVKKVLAYNQLGEPTEITESPGGGSEYVRKTVLTYDAAGRQTNKRITGGGAEIPRVETAYSTTNGLPNLERFFCTDEEKTQGCSILDSQAVTVSYDTLGRATTYEDADGNKAETTFDLEGRPVTSKDNKGSQALHYDSVSGLPVELEDSAAGKFTASYDADGNLVARTMPDGLTAETTFNEVDEPIHLTYTKQTFCGASCTWLDFGLERSVYGQILTEAGTLGTDRYGYDKAGRLTSAQETPQGGSCTSRLYAYDEDSNRKSLTTRSPGLGGICAESGGTTKNYSYDAADRLLGEGLTYDSFGRITKLPGSFAGGKELVTGYFADDMVASQSQNGVTNTFELDASLRQRSRLQAGGLEGMEVFHYDGSSDSPAWTERGTSWTRNIIGIGGELAAVQESGKEITLQLTNLHGDVSATAAINPEATSLKGTSTYDEFGNPTSGSAGRYGWLGGKQRRTELPSGVIQMGKRSYVPSLGRFLTPDPILGGSANPYDYANQDPVNRFDLTGEKLCQKVKGGQVCANRAKGLRLRVRHVRRVVERLERKIHAWEWNHPHDTTPTEKDGWTPCKVAGVGADTVGVVVGGTGLALSWNPIGDGLLLIGGGVDLAGSAADTAAALHYC